MVQGSVRGEGERGRKSVEGGEHDRVCIDPWRFFDSYSHFLSSTLGSILLSCCLCRGRGYGWMDGWEDGRDEGRSGWMDR